MKFLILNLLLANFSAFCKTPRLEVYFNSNDCVNCNNLIRSVKDLDPQIHKIFFSVKHNETIMNEIFQNLELPPDAFTFKYVPNDFFQCSRKNCPSSVISSYCIYYFDSQKKDSFSLKELPAKVAALKSDNSLQNSNYIETNNNDVKSLTDVMTNVVETTKINNFSVLIPDSIKFSENIRIFLHDSIINVLDVQLNKNVTFLMNTLFTKIKTIIMVKGIKFNPGPFMALDCFDTAFYRGFYPRLVRLGAHIPKIESAFVTDSTINLLLNLSYPRYPNPATLDSLRLKRKVRPLSVGDTIMDMKMFLYSKNIKTNKSWAHCIQDVSFERQNYWLVGLPFFLDKGKLFASIRNYNKPEDVSFLGQFNIVNNHFEFSNTRKNDSKNIKIKNLAPNQILNREVNSNFYFTTTLPFFVNFKRGEDFLLDSTAFDKTNKFLITDIMEGNGKINILVLQNEQIFLYYFNSKTKQRMNKKLIELPSGIQKRNIKFLGSNRLLILNEDKFQILEL